MVGSASRILHIINSTPIDWFSTCQSTVEAATYGSEFMAARLTMQQIIDMQLTLHYMGVPIDEPAWLFETMRVLLSIQLSQLLH